MLIHALARYIGWLHNEGVPAHRRKERSTENIKDVERAMRLLVECLRKAGYNINQISVTEITDEMIGKVYEYLLEEKQFGNRNFNKYFSYYTSFLKWYGEEYDVPVRNWFERVKRKKVNTNPESITEEEFNALLEIITPENGIPKYDSKYKPSRQLYRSWLKNGFRLALFTGRHREEIINLKFNDIGLNSDETVYVKVQDYKVNRIQNRNSDEEKKYIWIPVTSELRSLLLEFGLEKYKETNEFILAPEIKTNRTKGMSEALSKGFSHFFDQLNSKKKLTFKSLRKTYITLVDMYLSGNAKAVTGHSRDSVLDDHYIDRKKVVAKVAQRFGVLSKVDLRKNELETIRNESITHSKNQEVTK